MSRILAPAGRYEEIADRFAGLISGLKVGDPTEPDTVIGPLISAAHRDRVEGYIAQGVAEGATVRAGGRPAHLRHGWYVEPTLLTDVSNDMTVAQEEIFGPVTVLMPYHDEEEAIRIANDTSFGLAGTVFTADVMHGFEIARRIRTGTFSVNTYVCDLNSPFGGNKQSGIGREDGVDGLREYLQPKTISVDPSGELPAEILAANRAHTLGGMMGAGRVAGQGRLHHRGATGPGAVPRSPPRRGGRARHRPRPPRRRQQRRESLLAVPDGDRGGPGGNGPDRCGAGRGGWRPRGPAAAG